MASSNDPSSEPAEASKSAEAEAKPERSKHRRHRKRRLFLRVLIGAVLLVALLLAVVQVVLLTTLPRSLVLGVVQQQLGLRVEASTLKAGMFGKTSLAGVKLGLPLADTSAIEVPTMRVRHTALPLLLLGFGVEVKSIEIDDPTLHVSQDAAGRWNLAEVIELVARAGGKKEGEDQAAEATPSDPPKLPALTIRNATVHVKDNAGRSTVVERVAVTGRPDEKTPGLLYRYDVGVADRFGAKGEVVPGRNWRHEVRVAVTDIAAYVRPWSPSFPGVTLDAAWSGQVVATGGVSGRLELAKLAYTGAAVSGVMGVGVEGGTVSAAPERVAIETGQAALPTILVTGGKLAYDGKGVAAERLIVRTSGGYAQVDARYDPAARGGTVAAQWRDLLLPGKPATTGTDGRHSGRLDINLATRLGDRPEVRGTLVTDGKLSELRAWAGKFEIEAGGADFANLDWTVTAPTLALRGRQNVSMDGLTLAGQQRGPQITLASVRLPKDDRLSGHGVYNTQTQVWSAELNGHDWPLPFVWEDTLKFQANLSGDARQIAINRVTLGAADVGVAVRGIYLFNDPKPVNVEVSCTHEPPEAKAEVAGLPPPMRLPRGAAAPLVRGSLQGKARVLGIADPVNLTLDGDLTGTDIWFRQREIGNVQVKLKGEINEAGVAIYRPKGEPPIELLKGKWDLAASYDLDKEKATVKISVTDLPIAELGQAAGRDDVSGTVTGAWTATQGAPGAPDGALTIGGNVEARNVVAPGFAADRVTAVTTLQGGKLAVAPLQMWQGSEGYAEVTVGTDLSALRRLEITNLNVKQWPVPATAAPTTRPAGGETAMVIGARREAASGLPARPVAAPPAAPSSAADAPLSIAVDVSSKRIDVDLGDAASTDPEQRKRRVTSSTIALGTTMKMGVDIGRVDVLASLLGRVIDVRDIRGKVMGADLWGQSVIDFDHPLLATADVYLSDLRAERVALIAPGAGSVQGSFDMHARLQPVFGPAALEPMQLDITLQSNGANYAGAELGDARFRAFLNLDPYFGLLRVVLEDETKPVMPPVGGSSPDGTPAATASGAGGTERAGARTDSGGKTAAQLQNKAGAIAVDCAAERPEIPDMNTMHVAGGILRVWGRVVRHEDVAFKEGATALGTHLRLGFRCLSLDQLKRIGDPKAKSTPGVLNGSVVLFGTTGIRPPPAKKADKPKAGGPQMVQGNDVAQAAATQAVPSSATTVPVASDTKQPTLVKRILDNLYGDGAVEIRDADLGNLDIIAGLYDLMSLGQRPRGATGYGDATFRIEGGTLNLTSLHYFNRGVEVRAVARVDNLPDIPLSPLSGTAFGSARPLKDTKLPLLETILPDIDNIFAAVQQDSVSVEIGGTVKDPTVKPTVFGSIGRELQAIIAGDIKAELKGSAGK